jgi:uncharacterized protein
MGKMAKLPIFHLAFPVKDIESTLNFYRSKLGFPIDLIEPQRCIINFFDHQAVAHVSQKDIPEEAALYPRHFGIITEDEREFDTLLKRVQKSGLEFFKPLFVRFPESSRAHKTFFLKDPSNNLLEFKWYKNRGLLFKSDSTGSQKPLHDS